MPASAFTWSCFSPLRNSADDVGLNVLTQELLAVAKRTSYLLALEDKYVDLLSAASTNILETVDTVRSCMVRWKWLSAVWFLNNPSFTFLSSNDIRINDRRDTVITPLQIYPCHPDEMVFAGSLPTFSFYPIAEPCHGARVWIFGCERPREFKSSWITSKQSIKPQWHTYD